MPRQANSKKTTTAEDSHALKQHMKTKKTDPAAIAAFDFFADDDDEDAMSGGNDRASPLNAAESKLVQQMKNSKFTDELRSYK